MRPIKKKNEHLTGKYLKQILGPDVIIKEQYHLKESIYQGEELIRKYLLIDFEFKLKINNIDQQFLCEFNGQSHFKTIKRWFWDKDKLRKQKFRDKWLKSYCKNHNIILITINGTHIRRRKILIFLKRVLKPYLKNTLPVSPSTLNL